MKNIILVIALILGISTLNAQSVKSEKIKVYGNCSQCRSHIQKAAKLAGAADAKWDVDTKILTVSFDASKTSSKKIQNSIANAGYDTQDVTASNEAYQNLDECCQYDRKKGK